MAKTSISIDDDDLAWLKGRAKPTARVARRRPRATGGPRGQARIASTGAPLGLAGLVVVAAWLASPAYACECANRSTAELCAASRFVFSAEVVSVEPDDGLYRHHVRVLRVFRGPLDPEIDPHLGVPDELDLWGGVSGPSTRRLHTSCDASTPWPVGRLVMLMLDESRRLSVCTPAHALRDRAEAEVDPCVAPAPRAAGCAGCAVSTRRPPMLLGAALLLALVARSRPRRSRW